MQANLAGRLPVLDGFAKPGEHSLDRYERGYYQATMQVTSTASGGSLVRISTKVTAWYADPAGTHSGYELLTSNGRLEADLLDQLADQLAKGPTETGGSRTAASPPKSVPQPKTEPEPTISASAPKLPETGRRFSSSVSEGLAARELASEQPSDPIKSEKADRTLQAEAANLEEILKNQAHPKNLVAIKKSRTPVVATPSLTAKPQFLASEHDEFELLDFNADWVHVRISGLSRGWIWRNSVEMPDGMANTDTPAASALAPAEDLFHVTREETAQFPGDWEPLRNKNVKIISVQKSDARAKQAGPKERLAYAKFLLEKNLTEISQKPEEVAGIVLIFDSSDGGMIAATTAILGQWKAGSLSDSALWRKCFFDPPETFDSAAPGESQ